jgi:hypothetical protein
MTEFPYKFLGKVKNSEENTVLFYSKNSDIKNTTKIAYSKNNEKKI